MSKEDVKRIQKRSLKYVDRNRLHTTIVFLMAFFVLSLTYLLKV
jgi:hypothetical protein